MVWLVLQGLGMFPHTDNVMKKKLKDLFLVFDLYFELYFQKQSFHVPDAGYVRNFVPVRIL